MNQLKHGVRDRRRDIAKALLTSCDMSQTAGQNCSGIYPFHRKAYDTRSKNQLNCQSKEDQLIFMHLTSQV